MKCKASARQTTPKWPPPRTAPTSDKRRATPIWAYQLITLSGARSPQSAAVTSRTESSPRAASSDICMSCLHTHTDSVSVCQLELLCQSTNSTELNSNWIQLKQNLSELLTNSTQAEFTSSRITPAKFQCKALQNNGQVFVFPYPAVWGRSSTINCLLISGLWLWDNIGLFLKSSLNFTCHELQDSKAISLSQWGIMCVRDSALNLFYWCSKVSLKLLNYFSAIVQISLIVHLMKLIFNENTRLNTPKGTFSGSWLGNVVN